MTNLKDDQPATGGQPPEIDLEKVIMTDRQLYDVDVSRFRFFLGDFLPSTGVCCVSGLQGVGKSSWLLQLSLAAAYGHTEFLGYKMQTVHGGKVLFVASEDNSVFTSKRYRTQLHNLGEKPNGNFNFLAADAFDHDELMYILTCRLEQERFDCIILDVFSDFYGRADGNSNSQVRDLMKKWSVLANKYETLVILVAHINKSAYSGRVTLQSVQGASALTQRSRAVLALTQGEDDIVWLSVIKSNYGERINKAVALKFDGKRYHFTRTEQEVEADLLDNVERKETLLEKKKKLCLDIFGSASLTASEIYTKLMEVTQKSIASAKRDHALFKNQKWIEREGKKWRIKK